MHVCRYTHADPDMHKYRSAAGEDPADGKTSADHQHPGTVRMRGMPVQGRSRDGPFFEYIG